MLRYYVKTTEALKRLRTDKEGVVSLEYVIVGDARQIVRTAADGTFSVPGLRPAGSG